MANLHPLVMSVLLGSVACGKVESLQRDGGMNDALPLSDAKPAEPPYDGQAGPVSDAQTGDKDAASSADAGDKTDAGSIGRPNITIKPPLGVLFLRKGDSENISLQITRNQDANGIVVVTPSAPVGLTITPANVELAPNQNVANFSVFATNGAPVGDLTVPFSATTPGASDQTVANVVVGGPPGELDDSFATDGQLSLGLFPSADSVVVNSYLVATQRILVAGVVRYGNTQSLFVASYLPNGDLDTIFGAQGRTTLDIASADLNAAEGGYVVPAPGGQFWLIGNASGDGNGNGNNPSHQIVVAKILANGQVDSTFSGGLANYPFGVNCQVKAVAPYLGGAVIAATVQNNNGNGYDTLVTRLNANGAIDSDFGEQGQTVVDIHGVDLPTSLALDSAGGMLIATRGGQGNQPDSRSPSLIRLDNGGNLVNAFGELGIRDFPELENQDLARMLDVSYYLGQWIVVGSQGSPSVNPRIWRVNESGNLVTSFGQGGVVNVESDGASARLSQVWSEGDSFWAAGYRGKDGQGPALLINRFNTDGGFHSAGLGNSLFVPTEDANVLIAAGPYDPFRIVFLTRDGDAYRVLRMWR